MDALIRQGEGLLETFLSDPGFQGLKVEAVELPLSAPLIGPDGNPTDYQLVGLINLLLRATGYLGQKEPLNYGFNVLRKLKSPKIERHMTLCDLANSERFESIAQAVLAGGRCRDLSAVPQLAVRRLSLRTECRQ